jgi:hypothetical protein
VPEKMHNLGVRASVERRKRLKQWALDHDTSLQAIFDQLTDGLLSDGIPAARGVNTAQSGGAKSPGSGGGNSDSIPLISDIGREILDTLQEIMSALRKLHIQVDALSETPGAYLGREGKPPHVEDELQPLLGTHVPEAATAAPSRPDGAGA